MSKRVMSLMNWQAGRHFSLLLAMAFVLPAAMAQEAEPEAEEEAATVESEPVKSGPPPAIYVAAKAGRLQQLRQLLADGADINESNNNGRTALMGAAYYGNRRIVKELIIEGANVDAADAQGRTALMMAVINNDVDIASLLVGAGADLSLQDKKQNTAATFSEKIKNKNLAKLLEE